MSAPTPPGSSRLLLKTVAYGTGFFLFAPLVIIAIASFNASPYMAFPPEKLSLRWYVSFFTSRQWYQPALFSLQIAAVVSVLATVLGTFASIGLVRGRFPGRRALELFFMSPMIVPIIVLAVGFYFMFSPMRLIGNPVSLYVGHTILAIPLVIVVVSSSLRTTDPSMELAARSLGASMMKTLWFVTLPTIRPAIISGMAFAFLISFDEVVIAVFLGGPAATTLPKRMWDSIKYEIDPTILAVSTILVVATVLLMVGAELLRARLEKRMR